MPKPARLKKRSMGRARSRGKSVPPSPIEALEPRLFLSTTELIRDGGFQGTVLTSDWPRIGNFQADSRFTNYNKDPGYAYLADFTGSPANNISGAIDQQLTLPTNYTSITLTFYTKITTQETTTTAANDTMSAAVYDSTGTNILQNLATYSNLNFSGSYVQHTFGIDRTLAGQTIRLVFSAQTDAQLPTVFRIDDVSINAVAENTGLRSVGYFPDGRFSLLGQMDLSAVTHVNYAFASFDTNGNVVTSGWLNTSNLDSTVATMHAAGVPVSITFYSSTNYFPTLSASATLRNNFAASAVAFCLAHNLDGIDIDWEPPYSNNNPNYGAMIDAIYSAGHTQHLEITAAVNPYTNEIPAATVNSEMDWLNVMCYDFQPGDSSNYNDSTAGMQDWTTYGVTKSKLLMGLPFYGREGTTWSNTQTQVYTNIVNSYKNIFGTYPPPNVDNYIDPATSEHWYFNSVNDIEHKCQYIRDNGYGGVMMWELGEDHWDSNKLYDQYSLLPVIRTMMLPPSWLSIAGGSWSHLVNQQFFLDQGTNTITADASILNPNLTITTAAGTALAFNSIQHLAGLNISGAVTAPSGHANTIVTDGLTITGGKLDTNNNALIINYEGTAPLSTIRSYLASGRGTSGPQAATWAGSTGIISSYAHNNGNGYNIALGMANNADLASVSASGSYTSFAGQTVASNAILIELTYGADANMDNVVDGMDVAILGTHMNKPGSGQWYYGDFDYSGTCDGNDVAVLGTTFGKTSPSLSPAAIITAPAFAATSAAPNTSPDVATAVSEPEPAATPSIRPFSSIPVAAPFRAEDPPHRPRPHPKSGPALFSLDSDLLDSPERL